jgi:hypothetical protein
MVDPTKMEVARSGITQVGFSTCTNMGRQRLSQRRITKPSRVAGSGPTAKLGRRARPASRSGPRRTGPQPRGGSNCWSSVDAIGDTRSKATDSSRTPEATSLPPRPGPVWPLASFPPLCFAALSGWAVHQGALGHGWDKLRSAKLGEPTQHSPESPRPTPAPEQARLGLISRAVRD